MLFPFLGSFQDRSRMVTGCTQLIYSYNHKPKEKVTVFLNSAGKKFQREHGPMRVLVNSHKAVWAEEGRTNWPGLVTLDHSWTAGLHLLNQHRKGVTRKKRGGKTWPGDQHHRHNFSTAGWLFNIIFEASVFMHGSQCSLKSLLKCQ